MSVINVPSRVTKGEDLVIIPKKEYVALSQLKKIYEFAPTADQKRALKLARENLKRGKVLTLDELKRRLAASS